MKRVNDMSEIVLTVIVSTYQRASLMKCNLDRMLACTDKRVEFLVGDNASNDDTWKELAQIQDTRLSKFRNKKNLGFENFWLLSYLARGRYFIFVNDRDYIEPRDLRRLCDTLEILAPCDFISNEKTEYQTGYYGWEEAVKIYFMSRHPGTLIYSSAFCKEVLCESVLHHLLEKGQNALANYYLVFQLLLNVKKVYAYPKYLVNQPPNRERINKVREEYYGSSYISVEYRIKEYDGWMKYGRRFLRHPRIRSIMLAIYEDSLRTVTWEYFYSMKIPGFARRSGMEEHVPTEWFSNGIRLTVHIWRRPELGVFSIRFGMLRVFFTVFLDTVLNVLK